MHHDGGGGGGGGGEGEGEGESQLHQALHMGHARTRSLMMVFQRVDRLPPHMVATPIGTGGHGR